MPYSPKHPKSIAGEYLNLYQRLPSKCKGIGSKEEKELFKDFKTTFCIIYYRKGNS